MASRKPPEWIATAWSESLLEYAEDQERQEEDHFKKLYTEPAYFDSVTARAIRSSRRTRSIRRSRTRSPSNRPIVATLSYLYGRDVGPDYSALRDCPRQRELRHAIRSPTTSFTISSKGSTSGRTKSKSRPQSFFRPRCARRSRIRSRQPGLARGHGRQVEGEISRPGR